MKIRLSPMFPLTLLGGFLAIELASGCGTNEPNASSNGPACPPGFRCISSDSGPGRVLEGGAGGRGGAGGTGGAGGVSKTTPLGKACLQDSDCKTGLICLKETGTELDGGGPPGGLCTLACSTDPDCQGFDPNGKCVSVSTTSQTGYCMQGCTFGDATTQKCQGRSNFACDPQGFCTPTCGGDLDCGSRKCNLGSGLCVDSITGKVPIGTTCNPRAMPDTCVGGCTTFIGGGNTRDSVCSGVCQFGGDTACGNDINAGVPMDSFCLFAPTGAAPGDLGACAQLCDCNSDCLNKLLVCTPTPDLETFTFRAGLCVSKIADDGGTQVSIATCPNVPDAAPPPVKDAGKPPVKDAGSRDATKD